MECRAHRRLEGQERGRGFWEESRSLTTASKSQHPSLENEKWKWKSLSRVRLFIVHGILQARILEWVAMPLARGSSQPRDRTCISFVSCTGRGLFTTSATCEVPFFSYGCFKIFFLTSNFQQFYMPNFTFLWTYLAWNSYFFLNLWLDVFHQWEILSYSF